jgi:excisionase family DNA binding protein
MIMDKNIPRKYLSPKELADMLNVDITTVYGWTAMRNIPFHKFNKKLVRFDVSEIESWLKKNKVPTKSFT